MELDTISPLDGRYGEESAPLLSYFSERANLKYMTRVELAVLNEHLSRQGLEPLEDLNIDVNEVCRLEETTRHQVKALVNHIQSIVPDYAKPFVHLAITSSDTQDTANVLRTRDALKREIYPAVEELLRQLVDKMSETAHIPQMGRTHGQHAVPMTCGWWFTEYVTRIHRVRENMHVPCFGNISGAVGTFRALSYLYDNPIQFSEQVCGRLGLTRSECTTQILFSDSLVRVLGEINICFGIIANLADDIRNLQRSEIDEVEECFYDGQIGSSTMPHKHNPWNSEHVKSLWKVATPRYLTFSMDLISEHQRDLTNSASSRFVFEYLTLFYLAVKRMTRVISGLKIKDGQMLKHVKGFEDTEKAYVLLARAGVVDAHKVVQRLAERARDSDYWNFRSFLEHSEYWEKIKDVYDEVGKEDVIQEVVYEMSKWYRKRWSKDQK